MTVTNATREPRPTTFADILDKGVVIDAFVRVSLVGIELLTIDARIVLASVDTYLQFAEAVNRLELSERQPMALPELLGMDSGHGHTKKLGSGMKARGALMGVKKVASEIIGSVRRKDGHKHGD